VGRRQRRCRRCSRRRRRRHQRREKGAQVYQSFTARGAFPFALAHVFGARDGRRARAKGLPETLIMAAFTTAVKH